MLLIVSSNMRSSLSVPPFLRRLRSRSPQPNEPVAQTSPCSNKHDDPPPPYAYHDGTETNVDKDSKSHRHSLDDIDDKQTASYRSKSNSDVASGGLSQHQFDTKWDSHDA